MSSSPAILLYNPQPLDASSVALLDSIVEYIGSHPAQPDYVFLPQVSSDKWNEKLPVLAAPGSVMISSGRVDDWTLLQACAEHRIHYLGPIRDAQHLKSLSFHLNFAAHQTSTAIVPAADALSTAVDLTTQALRPSKATHSIRTIIETVPSSILDVAREGRLARKNWRKDSAVLLRDGSPFYVMWDLEDRPLASSSLTAPWNSIINHLSQRQAGLMYDYQEVWDINNSFANVLALGVSWVVSILSMLVSPSPLKSCSRLSTPFRLKTESESIDSPSDTLQLSIPSRIQGDQDSLCLVETAIVLLEGKGDSTGGVLTPSSALGTQGGYLLRQRLEERGGWVWK